MNEMRPTSINVTTLPNAVPSSSSANGKELPVDEEKAVENGSEVRSVTNSVEQKEVEQDSQVAEKIQQAVSEINEYVQSVQRDLHFSVDEDSGKTIIRVRDQESGELIRQIPEDIFLNLAQKLKDNQPLHLFDAHG